MRQDNQLHFVTDHGSSKINQETALLFITWPRSFWTYRRRMSTVTLHRPEFLRSYSCKEKYTRKYHKVSACWTMTMDSKPSQKENVSMKITKRLVPCPETDRLSNLQFDRLHSPEYDFTEDNRTDFGKFTAREAVLDEEYWTSAWLRAESHWEDKAGDRYVDSYKRKFAEQEFSSIKRRCKSQMGHKSTCILAVKNEHRNVILKNVVGTLDLSMRHLLHGETFPAVKDILVVESCNVGFSLKLVVSLSQEQVKIPLFCSIKKEGSKYGYISNLCVAKSARRQGIASSMLSFAMKSAKSSGAEQVFVHVHRNNKPAQLLYEKMGFEVVENASSQLLAEQAYLLCLKA